MFLAFVGNGQRKQIIFIPLNNKNSTVIKYANSYMWVDIIDQT